MPRTELYIGNLGRDVSRKDIESVFDKYGRLLRCDVKNRGFGAVFAFLEFEDERDAEDALRAENGKDMCGSSMVVEWAKNKGDRRDRDRFGGRDGRGPPRSLECYECGERGHFARDCNRRGGRGGARDRDRSRDRSRDRRRSRSLSDRSRDRSRDRRRDRSRDRSGGRDRRERDRSGHRRDRRHSRSASVRSRSKSRGGSRSQSFDRNRDRHDD